MRELVLKMSMSVDGFVSGPGGESDWMVRSRGADSGDWVLETLRQAGVHVMGRRTYHAMAGYWATSTDRMAAPMNDIPKVVFTRQATLDVPAELSTPDQSPAMASWASPRIANGDLVDEMRRLKEEPGPYILAQGGADFCRGLARLGLVDEYRLMVYPIVLGTGKKLFPDGFPRTTFDVAETRTLASGVQINVYRKTGA